MTGQFASVKLLPVARESMPTCEHHDFAAWQHKCVGLLAVHHDDLPLEPAPMLAEVSNPAQEGQCPRLRRSSVASQLRAAAGCTCQWECTSANGKHACQVCAASHQHLCSFMRAEPCSATQLWTPKRKPPIRLRCRFRFLDRLSTQPPSCSKMHTTVTLTWARASGIHPPAAPQLHQ